MEKFTKFTFTSNFSYFAKKQKRNRESEPGGAPSGNLQKTSGENPSAGEHTQE